MHKAKTITLWVLRILAGLGFLIAGAGKLTSNPQVIQMFSEWGYPNGFYMVIGILELAGAVLLLVPKTSFYAALGLMVIMIGAAITHLLHDPAQEVLQPVIFMLLLGGVAYLSKRQSQVTPSL